MRLRLYLATCITLLSATWAVADTVDPPTGDNICELSSLDLTTVTYYNDSGKNSVQANKETYGTPLVIRGTTYSSGVGTHADSKFVVKVNGAKTFNAIFGIDDTAAVDASGNAKTNEGIVDYTVTKYAEDKTATVAYSGTIKRTDSEGFTIADLDVSDAVYLVLNFDKGTNNWSDHVDVANAYFVYEGTAPELITESKMWVDDSGVIKIPTAPEGWEYIPLSSLDLTKTTVGWGTVQANKSIDGNDITLKGNIYESGVGTHGPSTIIVKLNGSVTEFHAVLGIDDEATTNYNGGVADYKVYLVGEGGGTQTLYEGTIKRIDDTAVAIDADVNGWKYLYLVTTNGTDGVNSNDHIDWANAYLVFQDQNSTRPEIVSEESVSSQLDCATKVFSQPGVKFMHKIKSTNPDAVISVTGLPDGLTFNTKRNIVEGVVDSEGEYTYQISSTVDGETTTEDVGFTVSKDLKHPTPFMGWLSWNSVQSEVSEAIVKQVVDLFVEKGLYEAGWNTIMMDDWWHAASRASDGKPQPNATRFPNGLTPVSKYVHDAGMKFGLYTDAATTTCAGAFGSYGYETIDAKQYYDWDVDVVKCDYCNAPSDVETAKARYKALADAFKDAGDKTMLYICEWGVREPWKWGAEVGGVCWRISQDVRDCWRGSGSGVGVVQSIDAMKNLSAWQGVNRFNDADMLCTALHGTGKSSNDLCATGPGMTQDEYRTQFALWCMWSSPMALSFDPRSTAITDDDYKIMTSKELIALNQDPMGQQADLISEDNNLVIFAKDLENGDVALSVTNLGSSAAAATFDFSKIPALDVDTEYVARDLWEEKDLTSTVKNSLTVTVKSHATRVFRLAKKSVASGITSKTSSADITITGTKDSIKVSCPGTKGINKRIVVTDTEGRVVSALSTTAETAVVNNLAEQVYVVRVVADAKSKAAKLAL